MNPPITATVPTIQETLSHLNSRREAARQGQSNDFRNMLDINSSRDKTVIAKSRPDQLQVQENRIDSPFLQGKAAGIGVESIIQKAAQTYGLDSNIIASIIQRQSNFDPQAKSPAGAQGLMQLMPATAAELGVTDAFDPEQNIMGGSRYLKGLVDRYAGDMEKALTAYTWGIGNVERNQAPLPKEVERFVAAVSGGSARPSTTTMLAEMNLSPPPATTASPSVDAIAERARQTGVDGIIQQAAQAFDLDPGLITAVIHAESDFDARAVSHAGAQGLMQLMPATAAELGVNDPFDPEQNIMGASRYLKGLVDRYDGKLELALAAYNWGMGNLERHPERMPSETRNYVAKILSLFPSESEDALVKEAQGNLARNIEQAARAYGRNIDRADSSLRT